MTTNRIEELLTEILKWQKFMAMQTLNEKVLQLLDSDIKERVYQLTDGKNTVRQIAEKTGIKRNKISKWWQEWHTNGILLKKGQKYMKLLPLD